MNIAFHYIYRDGANYKNFGTAIFRNDINIDLEAFKLILKNKLIIGEYFYADQLQLPDLHFGTWDNEIDHTFHEFESIEYTDEAANTQLSLDEFMGLIKAMSC